MPQPLTLQESLHAVLSAPSPTAVWELRGALRTTDAALAPEGWALLEQYHRFLTELTTRTTSREYSHFASLLDIGAVGGVAVQNLLDAAETGHLWRKLLVGGLSEGLMLAAARQYVKAWEGELSAVYEATTWVLFDALWQTSAALQPELDAARRRELVESLLAPARDTAVNGVVKAALLARLFQILLVVHLRPGEA